MEITIEKLPPAPFTPVNVTLKIETLNELRQIVQAIDAAKKEDDEDFITKAISLKHLRQLKDILYKY